VLKRAQQPVVVFDIINEVDLSVLPAGDVLQPKERLRGCLCVRLIQRSAQAGCKTIADGGLALHAQSCSSSEDCEVEAAAWGSALCTKACVPTFCATFPIWSGKPDGVACNLGPYLEHVFAFGKICQTAV